jgi:OmcA/MtrC family decaheme c-type cytochrome
LLTGGVDGKLEESIDFRTMIHAIHAGEAANGGFREKGITVYGYGGRAVSFADVVFPGNLANCTACHTATSYQLDGQWVNTGASGLLTTTTSTGTIPDDAADDLKTTSTAAVCASCHDNADAKFHMVANGDALFDQTFPVASAQIEKCSACHGVGRDFDVKTMHGVK